MVKWCGDCAHAEVCRFAHSECTEACKYYAEKERYGRWLKTQEPLGWRDVDCVECSACHDSWIIDEDYGFDDFCGWHYCPSCGAKMDEEGEA